MKVRKLLKKARTFGLAGISALGVGSQASAQEFAPQNRNIVEVGAYNSSSEWSYGPRVDINGFYVQVGRGLSDSLTAFLEGSVGNPVIKDGFSRPGHPDETFNVSPNHYIAGMAIGGRVKIFESEDKSTSLCGEVKLSRLSEFEDHAFWTGNERSDIHVDGITSLDATLWLQKNYGHFNFRGGAKFSSSFAEGEVLTHTVNSPTDVDTVYSPFNQRDKSAVSAVLGVDYRYDNGWTFRGTTQIGDGTSSIRIGASKGW